MKQENNRGAYSKSSARKRSIVEAALRIIDDEGHRSLTIARVAEVCDIPQPSVIYHFPTKAHLLVAALSQSEAEQLSDFMKEHDEDTDLGEFVQYMANYGISHRERLVLGEHLRGESADPNHPSFEHFQKRIQWAVAGISETIKNRQEKNLAHPTLDTDTVARQIMACWSGLQSQWLIDPSFDLGKTLAETVRHLTKQDTMEAKRRIATMIEGI